MDRQAAKLLALTHIEGLPTPHQNYRFAPPEPKEIEEGWWFGYQIEPVRQLRPDEQQLFAGAPGFIVLRDGSIREVDRAEWQDRRLWE